MIRSFKDRRAEALYRGEPARELQAIRKVALRKLDMLAAARRLEDLASPPGNRLEALSGDRLGQHSMRINDRWRLAFVWNDGAEDVEIVDYH